MTESEFYGGAGFLFFEISQVSHLQIFAFVRIYEIIW